MSQDLTDSIDAHIAAATQALDDHSVALLTQARRLVEAVPQTISDAVKANAERLNATPAKPEATMLLDPTPPPKPEFPILLDPTPPDPAKQLRDNETLYEPQLPLNG